MQKALQLKSKCLRVSENFDLIIQFLEKQEESKELYEQASTSARSWRTQPTDRMVPSERYELIAVLSSEISILNEKFSKLLAPDGVEVPFCERGDGCAEDDVWTAYHMACKVSRNIDVIIEAISDMGFAVRRTMEEFDCPICLASLKQVPHITSCNHVLCVHCWCNWHMRASGAPTCPICRRVQGRVDVGGHVADAEELEDLVAG